MADTKKKTEIKDEPGAEERFKRGIERALNTPPKPHKEVAGERKPKAGVKGESSPRRRPK
jgi:hypothetical protein